MQQLNITLTLYGSAACLILLAYLWMNGNKAEKSNRFFIVMCLLNIGMMLGDIPTQAFEGFAQLWYPAALKNRNGQHQRPCACQAAKAGFTYHFCNKLRAVRGGRFQAPRHWLPDEARADGGHYTGADLSLRRGYPVRKAGPGADLWVL